MEWVIKLSASESEAVERAWYDAESWRRLLSVLARSAEGDAGKKMLEETADAFRKAQVRLMLAQRAALDAHGAGREKARWHFDFTERTATLEKTAD